ncbi:hypothetical protein LCGC14_1214770 [marine sediment metagenome]|uniref:Uncharacterized protein n=1 Tax=marine sediment metagenome TaxID=412755 RepID=A0A0F9PHP6_9ZZZZ
MKNKQKPPLRKARIFDNHYRSDSDEYEFIARTAHELGISIAEYTRSKLIPENSVILLAKLRKDQRKAGDLDEWFIHPKLKKSS